MLVPSPAGFGWVTLYAYILPNKIIFVKVIILKVVRKQAVIFHQLISFNALAIRQLQVLSEMVSYLVSGSKMWFL